MSAPRQVAQVRASTLTAATLDHVSEQALEGYKALVTRTVGVFGDEFKAARWLSLPNRDLDGQTPLQAARKTGYDLRVIEPILIRMEHGVDY
jgi:uncharacterized protein (DUF2384 family)